MSLRKIKRRQRMWAHTICIPLFLHGGGLFFHRWSRSEWRKAIAPRP